MFKIQGSNFSENDNNLSILMSVVLKDESSKYVCGDKELMLSCDNKYEASFLFIKDNSQYIPYDVCFSGKKLRENDNSEEYFFKNARVKSFVQSDTELFVIIVYDWVFNINEDEKKEFYEIISNYPVDTPITREIYKKYKKYFYIFGTRIIGKPLTYKVLTIDNDGVLVYKEDTPVKTMPATFNM